MDSKTYLIGYVGKEKGVADKFPTFWSGRMGNDAGLGALFTSFPRAKFMTLDEAAAVLPAVRKNFHYRAECGPEDVFVFSFCQTAFKGVHKSTEYSLKHGEVEVMLWSGLVKDDTPRGGSLRHYVFHEASVSHYLPHKTEITDYRYEAIITAQHMEWRIVKSIDGGQPEVFLLQKSLADLIYDSTEVDFVSLSISFAKSLVGLELITSLW